MTSPQLSKTKQWLGLFSLIPGIAMVFIDQAILPVALPTIQEQLEASQAELWWSVNAYLLISAVLLLAGGKCGDWLGYRRAFSWGTVLFAFASLLCGLSQNMAGLIAARGLQGVGAALMIPASSPLVMSLFPQNERGKATGINVSITSLFLIIAPLLGGYCTQYLSWRWIFWLNVPLAAIGLILLLRFLPRSETRSIQIDLPGFCFFVLSAGSLIGWIMQGPEWGWLSLHSALLLGFGLITGGLLFYRESKIPHPLIDLSLFRQPVFRAVNISIFAAQFVLMITVYRAVFFQETLHWTAFLSGTVLFFTSLPVLVMPLAGGWLADRYGPKWPLSAGFCFLLFSFFWLAYFVDGSFSQILIGLVPFGFGIPLIFTPSYTSAMGAVPPKKAGAAFGLLATVRSLSSSLSVAIIGSFTNALQTKTFSSALQENAITKNLPASWVASLASGNPEMQKGLSKEQLDIVSDALQHAEQTSFVGIHLFLGVLILVAFLLAFRIYHRHRPSSPHLLPDGWD